MMADWQLLPKNGLRFYRLEPSSGIELWFSTRRGSDNDSDHNMGIGDQLVHLGIQTPPLTMNQTHSNTVERVERSGEVQADACFTTQANLALSVRVADCVPIFLWDSDNSFVGIVHAGWRGTLAKIALRFTEKVEKEMGTGAHRLNYALGPSIGKCCYKVGEEILDAFRQTWPEAQRFFSRNRDGLFLDLRAANRFLLSAVGAVEGKSLDLCTSCERKRFYSYRREPGDGRNWGFIIRTDK